MEWLMVPIRWLSQWMPETAATVIVGAVVCLAIGIPLSEAWVSVRTRWWDHITRNERRLFLVLLVIGVVLLSRGRLAGLPELVTGGLIAGSGALAVVAYSLLSRRTVAPVSDGEWETRSETAPNFPVIPWLQEVDTGRLQKHARADSRSAS